MPYVASQEIAFIAADIKRRLELDLTPTPGSGSAPSPNNLVVNRTGPTKTNSDQLFDAGTFTPAVKYVHTGACENEVRLFCSVDKTSYLRVTLGNRFFTPVLYVNGVDTGALHTHDNGAPFVAGDVLDLDTSVTANARILTYRINGESVKTYVVPTAIEQRLSGMDGRTIDFKYNSYVQAQNAATVTMSGGVISPLVLKASDIDTDGYVFWDVEYIGSPPGFLGKAEDQLGTTVIPYDYLEVVSNPEPGKCRLRAKTRVETRGVGYNYTLVQADANGQPVGQVYKMRRTRLKPGMIGSNVAFTHLYYRLSRVYTNMFRQSEIRGIGFDYPTHENNPDLVSAQGEPLKPNTIQYLVQGPDTGGAHMLKFSTKTGSACKIRVDSLTGNHAGIGSAVYDGRTARVPVIVDTDKMLAGGGNTALRITITDFDPADPPKGLFLCEDGEDETQLYHKKWLDRQKQLRGHIRCMDLVQANEPFRYDHGRDDFDLCRARQSILGTQNQVTPLEDLVELSVATGRPLWFNISVGLMYSDKGTEYVTRALQLIFNGVGSDIGYGVSTLLRHKIEMGNELWNSLLTNWRYLAARAREAGRATSANNDNSAANIERVYQYIRCMRLAMAAIPNWADRFDRVFGVQMEQGDLFSNVLYTTGFDEALTLIDQFAIAPYLPGDPVAGYAPGQQPVSHSPEDVVAWLRGYLPGKMAELSAFVQKCLNTFGIPVVLYEWNIAYSTIGNRTKQEERAIKRSQVMYDFMRHEYIPPVAAVGDAAMYSDDGAPGEGSGNNSQSWSFFEGPFEGAGNRPWDAVIDYNLAQAA